MELEEQEKDYITFLEIIMMLRGEYKSIHKSFDELSKNIQIDSKYETDSNLNLTLKDELFKLPTVVLDVSRKANVPSVQFRQFMNKYFKDDLRRIVDNASFLLDDNFGFSFEQLNKQYLKNEFSPRVLINDKEKFSCEYEKLKMNSLFNLPFMNIKLNSNQSLIIGGDSVTLMTNDGGTKRINIKYDSSSDNIKVDSNIRYNSFFIEQLLNTGIPMDMLPPEYISLFSESEADTNLVFEDDMGGFRDETLEFVRRPKALSLSLIKRNYK